VARIGVGAGEEGIRVSNLPEIKQRLDRITQLSNGMKDQFKGLNSPERKKKAKEQGTRMGIGAGISFFGLILAWLASLYILLVVILLVDLGIKKLWLSALIVVAAFLIIGGVVLAIGAVIAKKAGKELSANTQEMTAEVKKSSEEIKTEIEELQKLAKAESEERQKQLKELAEAFKKMSPAIIGGLMFLKWMHKKLKRRKEKKRLFKVLNAYEDVRESREISEEAE
jgi:predicted PurR-regulated permease PerM